MSIRSINNFKGEEQQIDCIGCAIEQGKINKEYTVFSTDYFGAHQDYEIPIPGFIIVSTRRHIQSIEEFNDGEKADFTNTLIKVRKALRQVLKIEKVYFHQEEDTSHHFHVWIFPRYDWMAEKFGTKIESVRPIMEYAKANLKTPENLQKVDEALKKLKIFFK
jgi:diadenosine tetraphosphate (Ap4A) HIT family hydrolase